MGYVENVRFHDSLVNEYIARRGGTFFQRAPFDVIDGLGNFIEVKKMRVSYNGYRIHVSKEQVTFATRKKLWLYLAWGDRRSLIPLENVLLKRLLGTKLYVRREPSNALHQYRQFSISKRLLITRELPQVMK